MPSTTYLVDGMTCEHCVRAVTQELAAVRSVTAVAVELVVGGSSRVRVTSEDEVAEADIAAAVDEAGYVLAGAGPP